MDRIYGILGIAAKAGKVISGFDSIKEGAERKKLNLIILAHDTSDKTKKEMKFICDKYQIPLVIFGSIEGNSHSIGKRNRAILGICDSGFSKRFLELLDEENKNT